MGETETTNTTERINKGQTERTNKTDKTLHENKGNREGERINM